VYQQLSIKAAGTIFSRLTALCGGEDRYTPETLLAQVSPLDTREVAADFVVHASYVIHSSYCQADGAL
jgi:3-methyladenine DNA glycosylase/8-oxoguanine DNA glycosylase